MTSSQSGFATVLAATLALLCLGAPVARAQSVPYWTSTTGFNSNLSSNLTSETNANANAFGNFSLALQFRERLVCRHGTRQPWFWQYLVWCKQFQAPSRAFGSASAYSYEGSQVGYNFKSAPVSIYAGLDTLKYNNAPIVGSPFSAFDSSSANVPGGYRVNAGVEFRPTSNLTQPVGRREFPRSNENDINSSLLPGASPFGSPPRKVRLQSPHVGWIHDPGRFALAVGGQGLGKRVL